MSSRGGISIRALLDGSKNSIPTTLGAALAVVSREQSALGLRVHQKATELPADLPVVVIDAIVGATREALNNVVKHAGVGDAWVTATAPPREPLCIFIVDHGVGFHPDHTCHEGLGIAHSIRRRMSEIGGDVRIDSAPGEGTVIELRWTA